MKEDLNSIMDPLSKILSNYVVDKPKENRKLQVASLEGIPIAVNT